MTHVDVKREMWNVKVKWTAHSSLVCFSRETRLSKGTLGTQNNVCPCLWSNRQSRGNGWILSLKKKRGGKQGSKKTEREREGEGEEGWRTAREGRECVVWEPCAWARRVCDWSCSRHRMTHTGGRCSSTRPYSHTHTLIYKYDVCKLWQLSKNRWQHTGTCIQQLVLCNESNPTQTGQNRENIRKHVNL